MPELCLGRAVERRPARERDSHGVMFFVVGAGAVQVVSKVVSDGSLEHPLLQLNNPRCSLGKTSTRLGYGRIAPDVAELTFPLQNGNCRHRLCRRWSALARPKEVALHG